MPDHPSATSGVLRRPFTQQTAFFRRKLGRLVPTQRWDDLEGAEHDTAFVVAGAQKADLLSDLATSIDRAVTEGKSLDAFRKDFNRAVARHDWHGWTGEDTKGGRAWRTRTIYRTNAATSYAAGRRAQLEQGNFPLWVYRHGDSVVPRPMHLEWDGFTASPSHGFWVRHTPVNEWGCTCYLLGARSERGARRLGGDPDKQLPEGWDTIDPATGAPPGIGKGWGYAPGASVSPQVRAAAEKVRHWDYRIAKGFMEELPPSQRDALAASYRALPSVADDARRYARRILGNTEGAIEKARTLGPLTQADVASFAELAEQDVAGFDFMLDESAVRHVQNQHGDAASEAERGQRAVTADDYAMLPAIVARGTWSAAGTNWRTGQAQVQIVYRRVAVEYVTVWERRGKARSLALVSFAIRNRRVDG